MMKNKHLLSMLLFVIVACCLIGCKKLHNEPTELEKLPPATQTGENTFGCLVNGQAFLPHANILSNSYEVEAHYEFYNNAYSLKLYASNDSNSNYISSFILATTDLAVSEGQTLKLENYNTSGKAFGQYALYKNFVAQSQIYQTNSTINGSLHIVKFDLTKQIVSGTFFLTP